LSHLRGVGVGGGGWVGWKWLGKYGEQALDVDQKVWGCNFHPKTRKWEHVPPCIRLLRPCIIIVPLFKSEVL